MAYQLRNMKRKEYKQMSDVRLPRPTRLSKAEDELYPVEITEKAGDRVKIHYVGYSSDTDEWKEAREVVDIAEEEEVYMPFEPHRACIPNHAGTELWQPSRSPSKI